MPDLPPPTGYESWLDWAMDRLDDLSALTGDVVAGQSNPVRQELAILRAKAEAFDAVAEQLDSKFVRDVADRLAAIEKEYGDA